MTSDRAIRVVRLTPLGRGAIATVLVAGTGAAAMVDGLFRPRGGRRLAECATDRIVVGRFGEGEDTDEEMVARRVSDEDEEILLHCHGGTAAVERIEALLVGRGAVATDWPTWAADSRADRLRAEALVALAKATTGRTAGILLDQYQGALRTELSEIRAAVAGGPVPIFDTCPHPNPLPEGEGTFGIDRLLGRAALGLHLVEPWRVVLAGPPNSGKSSLANALLGYRRAIVHATSGTTRDVLAATTSIEGWPVELIDTAGLRQGGHPVETEGVHRAWQQVATADLVVLVFDASQPLAEEDWSLLEKVAKGATGVSPVRHVQDDLCTDTADGIRAQHGQDARGTRKFQPHQVLFVHNKSDLAAAPGDRPEGLSTSALSGEGMPGLLGAIAERLVPEPPAPGEAVPWTQRQIEHLSAARAALVRGDTTEAAAWLGQLLW